MSEKRILLGEFGRAQGLRGEVRIKSHTGDPMSIARYAPLTDESGERIFRILSARPHQNDMIVARLDGVNDRTAAEALARLKIFAPRSALDSEPLGEGEFLQSDLIGLSARLVDGREVGQVAGIENYGAGDLLAIAIKGRREPALLPFSDDFAPQIDIQGGFILINPPEGWDEE
ncbi:MAG: 16S rRNA processing protein RimM [Rhizobiales bacterium 65-9]|nr:ribosome maturation factor RimM [Hyphomicrobiales bacterium]OJY36554.1 MAG: 16S rRNA processing protein RimM [Rhizobiales bacterium 65-9]